jgi:hypothetical protein
LLRRTFAQEALGGAAPRHICDGSQSAMIGKAISMKRRIRSVVMRGHLCKDTLPATFRGKTSLDSPPRLVYGFAAGGPHPFAEANEFLNRRGR